MSKTRRVALHTLNLTAFSARWSIILMGIYFASNLLATQLGTAENSSLLVLCGYVGLLIVYFLASFCEYAGNALATLMRPPFFNPQTGGTRLYLFGVRAAATLGYAVRFVFIAMGISFLAYWILLPGTEGALNQQSWGLVYLMGFISYAFFSAMEWTTETLLKSEPKSHDSGQGKAPTEVRAQGES